MAEIEDITYAAERLAASYKDILLDQSDDLALDLDLLLIDRSTLTHPDAAHKSSIAAQADAFWIAHPEQFNEAMEWFHNPESRAVHNITKGSHWWWWPIENNDAD